LRNPNVGQAAVGGGLGAAVHNSDIPSLAFQKSGPINNDKKEMSGTKGMKDALKKAGDDSGRSCRICLDEADSPENPFITPCKCDGSMKYIHLTCLREWLDSKRVSQKLEGVYSYYWEELSCELCKDPLALSKIKAS